MNRLTIITKLRFAAALAPALLLLAAPLVALSLYGFGALPAAMYENQYAAIRAAEGMEAALYKMDWGRTQPDSSQIVFDQGRRLAGLIDSARIHVQGREQAERIQKIADAAAPLIDAMRKASPGDDSFEPRLRDLQGLVSDLIGTDDALLMGVSSAAASRARTMMVVMLIAGVLAPWACFAWMMGLTSPILRGLREIRHRTENLAERVNQSPEDISAIDRTLTALGFAKPNPMLAE